MFHRLAEWFRFNPYKEALDRLESIPLGEGSRRQSLNNDQLIDWIVGYETHYGVSCNPKIIPVERLWERIGDNHWSLLRQSWYSGNADPKHMKPVQTPEERYHYWQSLAPEGPLPPLPLCSICKNHLGDRSHYLSEGKFALDVEGNLTSNYSHLVCADCDRRGIDQDEQRPPYGKYPVLIDGIKCWRYGSAFPKTVRE